MTVHMRAVRIAAAGLLGALLLATPIAARAQAAGAAPAGSIEQRVRQRLGAIVRQELGLDEARAQQLGQVSARYEQQRRALARRERDLRLQLRDELSGDTADHERVARALDRMIEVQRERVDILQREQAEMAKFLTPVQRAKYLALQDQVRRRLEEARRAREGAPGAAPARPRRPGVLRPRSP